MLMYAPNMAAMYFSSVVFTVVLTFNFHMLSRDHYDSPLIYRDFIGKQSGFKKRNFYRLSAPSRPGDQRLAKAWWNMPFLSIFAQGYHNCHGCQDTTWTVYMYIFLNLPVGAVRWLKVTRFLQFVVRVQRI